MTTDREAWSELIALIREQKEFVFEVAKSDHATRMLLVFTIRALHVGGLLDGFELVENMRSAAEDPEYKVADDLRLLADQLDQVLSGGRSPPALTVVPGGLDDAD